MKLFWLLIAVTVLSAAERTGPFLSAGVGLSRYWDDSRLQALESRNVPSYRAGAGAFINTNFSVGLEYTHFSAFQGEERAGSVTEYFKALCLDVVVHYPLRNDQIDLFAKFGAGQLFWNEEGAVHHDSSAATLLYGIGVGVRPLEWLTVNVGYDIHHFGMDGNMTSYDMRLGSAYIECQVQF